MSKRSHETRPFLERTQAGGQPGHRRNTYSNSATTRSGNHDELFRIVRCLDEQLAVIVGLQDRVRVVKRHQRRVRLAHLRVRNRRTRVESLNYENQTNKDQKTHSSVGARACRDERVSEEVARTEPLSWISDQKRADEVF